MKFTLGLAFAVVTFVNAAMGEGELALKGRWMGSLGARAKAETIAKRQIELGEGGFKLGGDNSKAAAGKQQGENGGNGGGGLRIGGLTLGGPGGGISFTGNNQQAQEGQKPPQEGQKTEEQNQEPQKAGEVTATAGNGTAVVEEANSPKAEVAKGKAAEAETAKLAEAEAKAANSTEAETANRAKPQVGEQVQQQEEQRPEEAKAEGNLAVQESERFSEGFGITTDQNGNVVNSGGNLGITQGSDGSKSIGGENGINIASNGEATIAGNEKE